MKSFNSKKEQTNREEEEKLYVASQWQLVWRKFRKHKVGLASLWVLALFYFSAIFCEFLSPYDPFRRFDVYRPPQRIHFFDEDKRFTWPFVYGTEQSRDSVTFRKISVEDKTRKYSLRFFERGDTYKFWNLFRNDLHLFDTEDGSIFVLGTDKLGRDMFSRILYGGRISLSIGVIGIGLMFALGLALGGIAGYAGGVIDEIIMRVVDLLMSMPKIPLWIALAAALPARWSSLEVYFAITVILSLLGWPRLARVVRGKLLALREEDFALAAKLAGCGQWRIIIRHLLPSFASYLLVSVTLAIPGMILAETALTFIGVGLRPPVISWGVLLQGVQKLEVMQFYPWVFVVVFFIIASVLAFNFTGDAMRDSADPYR